MYSRRQIPASRTVAFLLCFGFILSSPVFAAEKPDPATQESVQKGNALFQQSCAVCHGVGATGGAGPNLLDSAIVRRPNYYGGEAALVIQGGRVDRGMPAFPSMTDADVADILAFLQERARVFDSESSESNRATSLKRLLTGDATAGKQYFYGQGRCSTCHSPTGDLSGIANKYRPENLQTRFLYPPDDHVTATVSFPFGKTIKGKLLHLDAFYVAILDENGGYHSWPLRAVKVQVDDPLSGHLELLSKYKDKDIHNVFAYLETLK
jgi:cytochrome c oxidase cbb3-type subunit 3